MDKQSKSVIAMVEKIKDERAKSILRAAATHLNDPAIEYLALKIWEGEHGGK